MADHQVLALNGTCTDPDASMGFEGQRTLTLPLYQIALYVLSWPSIQNWREIFIIAALLSATFSLYGTYRQRKLLKAALRSPTPAVYLLALGEEGYRVKLRTQLVETRDEVLLMLYQATLKYVALSSEVLPRVWALTQHKVSLISLEQRHRSSTISDEQPALWYSYAVFAVLFTIFTVPLTYHHVVMSTSPSATEVFQDITTWKGWLGMACGAHLMSAGLVQILRWVGFSKNKDTFDAAMPLLCQRLVTLGTWVPMDCPKTKESIESAANQCGITFKEILVCEDDAVNFVQVYGSGCEKIVVVSGTVKECCIREEIEALVTSTCSQWTSGNDYVRMARRSFVSMVPLMPFLILGFNWRSVLTSMGFTLENEHPFVVVILLFGFVVDSLFDQICEGLLYALEQWNQMRGDLLTAKKGYGKHLTSALFKLEPEDIDVVVLDNWYTVLLESGYQTFDDRLRALGWIEVMADSGVPSAVSAEPA